MPNQLSDGRRRKVAVVGGGIAGIAAAHLIQKKHDVTIFEAAPRLGGHACAIEHEGLRLETAFLIFNELTYPCFMQLLGEWGVLGAVQRAEMSACFSDEERDIHYALGKGLGAVLFRKSNLFRGGLLRVLAELILFRRRASRDLASGSLAGLSLGDYLRGSSLQFRENLVLPLAMAIWSLPRASVLEHPAESILAFFENHRLLRGPSGKGWRSLAGSSSVYVESFRARFPGAIRLNARVERVRRPGSGVILEVLGREEAFDDVVIALHANDALSVLADPTELEKRALGSWRYHANAVTLHKDAALMPRHRELWASWNSVRARDGTDMVTYHLNRVQRLQSKQDYFLTLGDAEPSADKVIRRLGYSHPVFDRAAIESRALLASLNGAGNSYYCGSYFGHGFHEDAAASAARVASAFGAGFDEPV